jgi:hypothetical protein
MCMAKRQQACSRLLKLTSWQILMPKSENFYINFYAPQNNLGATSAWLSSFCYLSRTCLWRCDDFSPFVLGIFCQQIIISVCYPGQLVTLLCRVTKVMLDQASTITNNRSILLCVFFPVSSPWIPDYLLFHASQKWVASRLDF